MAVMTLVYQQALPILGVLIAVYIARKIAISLRLRAFKGPAFTGLSDWPHSIAILSSQCHTWYEKINKKYGPIARVAPEVLVTSSPAVWAHVNKHPDYKRSDWYYQALRLEYRQDNVFTLTDNAKHEFRRKQMAPGYSGRENLDLELSIDDRINDFLKLIRSKYISTPDRITPMDLAEKVQFFTLDVISTVGLGKCFGMLENDKDVDDYLKSSEDGLAVLGYLLAFGIAWVTHLPVIGYFLAPSPKGTSGFSKMMATCFRFVDERASNPTDKRSDMMASFIRHGLRGDELRTEGLEQVIAGSDTTAGGLRGALLHVMANPRVLGKLREEANQALESNRVPAVGEGPISFAQAKRLPYLQAVIRESLRVWPPVANLFSRDVPPNGDTVEVDGKQVFLPGGVCIGYSAYAMHRSTEIYGEDATAFRPERWFEKDQDKLNVMIRTNDLMFGYGRFQCLGMQVAQIELSKLIYELMINFDVALLDPTNPWKAVNTMGLFTISDMWVQVMKR